MPRTAKKMTAKSVAKLSHPRDQRNHLVAVGGVSGLALQLTPGGSRSWILRTTIGGRRRWLGIGPYPEVSLEAAREDAAELRRKIRLGNNPIEEREREQAQRITFADAMERFLKWKIEEFRNEKHKAQWRSTLDRYAVPVLGSIPVAQIGVDDVLRALKPIWNEKTETASRLRGRMEGVLAWATTNGYRSGVNPARWKGNLDTALPKPSKITKSRHHGALSVEEIADWWRVLSKRQGASADALRFLALTSARSGEVRGMTWAEVDIEKRTWVIPAERMKAGKEHRVPLCDEALTILLRQPREAKSETSPVFRGMRGGPLSDMSLSAVMKKIAEANPGRFLDQKAGRPAVPHGLRSTFRDWAAERGVDRDLAEMALAHTVGSQVERAYRRSDMFERRRKLGEDWCAFVQGLNA